MTDQTRWTGDNLRKIRDGSIARASLINADDFTPIAPDMGVWDAWPVQEIAGTPVRLARGGELWMALGAPRFDDPDERHAHARIHLVLRDGDTWRHLGPAMPAGFSPGSREWSGSSVVDLEKNTVTLYFTATGQRGESTLSFEQRIFSAEATLDTESSDPRLIEWRNLREIIHRDPEHYMSTMGEGGEIGKIKAFRDPAFFRDPGDGHDYLLFSASCARSISTYNGVVGIARRDSGAESAWQVLPPLVSADELNNELERPHIVHHCGFYYLFWSTQSHVFNPAGPAGPTGLYGMVSDTLLGGWRPLNGSGVILSNPLEAPAQAYSWWVLPDLSVVSFVDDWGAGTARNFGGTFAPVLRLRLQGDSASIEE